VRHIYTAGSHEPPLSGSLVRHNRLGGIWMFVLELIQTAGDYLSND
jgi:hypothetical protein